MPADAEAPAAPRRGRPGYDQEQMLEVIVKVFTDHGYDAATLELIAKRLGLSKSAVYHHFTSKQEMLELALDRVLGALEAVFSAPDATTGRASDRIRTVVAGAVRVACEQRPYLLLLLGLHGNSEIELQAMERRRGLMQSCGNCLNCRCARVPCAKISTRVWPNASRLD